MKRLLIGILLSSVAASHAMAATNYYAVESNIKIFGKENISTFKDRQCSHKQKILGTKDLFRIDKYGRIHDKIGKEKKKTQFYWVNPDGTCGAKIKNEIWKGELRVRNL